MKRQLLIVILITCCLQGNLFAQRTIRWSQLNFAQGINNPAAISVDGSIMADLIARNQWFGFEGAPTTFGFNGQYELTGDMAVGLVAFHDQIGVRQTTGVSGQYAYRVFMGNGKVIAMGLAVGMDNYVTDYTRTSTTQVNDPAFQNNFHRLVFNSAVGVYYYSPKFYLGLSLPEMYNHERTVSGPARLRFDPHYYLSSGFYFDIGERFTLNPHLQVKAARNTPIAGDLILRNTINGRFSIVVGYRTEQSLIGGLDFLITPFLRAGYAFNYDIGQLSKTKGMSNELYLGIAFPYRNSREDFGKRRYIDNKGGFKRDYKRNYHSKNKIRVNRYH